MSISDPGPGASARDGAVRSWAAEYRARGYQALPSWTPGSGPEGGRYKKPLVRYAGHRDRPLPGGLFEKFPGCNVQVMTGVAWSLLVVDLDGAQAPDAWGVLSGGRAPRTWSVRTGSGGVQLWFSCPPGVAAVPSRRLWGVWDAAQGGWRKHVEVRLLADGSLAMAPPSVHESGRPYLWLRGRSPFDLARPAIAPRWLLALPEMLPPGRSPAPRPTSPRVPAPAPRLGPPLPGAREILDAIPPADKVALARLWGLRLASDRPNAAGWIACHAVGREDRTPSASFSATTGRYWEPDLGRSGIGFLDLAARLGAYAAPGDALRDLAARYRVR